MTEKLDAETAVAPSTNADSSASTLGIALAFDEARDRPELATPLIDYLGDQRAFIADQRHHLKEQFKHLRLAILSERFSIALRALTALVGLIFAAGLTFMIWDAAQPGGLVIEPFSVPPDLVEQGLSGKVVASKLLDVLGTMQAQTDSQRNPKTYANYWADDIKVEIPETSISISELNRYLREQLGHPTHITGEIVHSPGGQLDLTARAGSAGSGTASGSQAEFEALIGKVAESIYRMTEPYRYSVWLREHGRIDEGMAVAKELAHRGPARERPWGYLGWANSLEETEGYAARLNMMRQVAYMAPDMYLARDNICLIEDKISLPGQAVRDCRAAAPLLAGAANGGIRDDVVPIAQLRLQALIDQNFGAFHDASQLWNKVLEFGPQGTTYSLSAMVTHAQLAEHDLAGARSTMEAPEEPEGSLNAGSHALDRAWAAMLSAFAAEQWEVVIESDAVFQSLYLQYPGLRSYAFVRELPWLAIAHAQLGNFSAAELLLRNGPEDCDICLRTRARIAEMQKQHARADALFASAVQRQPETPFAYADWGATLLARGDIEGAIAKLKLAHQKGPRFAEPLESWGEALMRQGKFSAAAAKFSAAKDFAPRWGHIHLRLGETLLKLGDGDGARKEFGIAASLDLSAPDRSELNKLSSPP